MLGRSDRYFSAWNDGPAHLGVLPHVSMVEQVVARNYAVRYVRTLDRRAVRDGLARQGLSVSAPEVGRLLRREARFGAVPERLLADTIRLATGPREQLPAPVAKLADLALRTL